MKKLVSMLLIAGLILTSSLAFSKETTGRSIDDYEPVHHTHQYGDDVIKDRPALEAGVGLDLLLFEFGDEAKNLKKVKLELKKDFVDKQRASAYLVAEINVTSIFAFLKK